MARAGRWGRGIGIVVAAVGLAPARASADEPIVLRETWSGHMGFFATGAAMAVDGPDADTTNVDDLAQPASVVLGPPDLPAGAELRAAFLYWGGSTFNSECDNPGLMDADVDFTPPGGVAQPVVADVCFCSEAGALSYDEQLCRANITSLVSVLEGTYTVDSFSALITNSSTSNASFSIVVVFRAPALPPRRIALYDGLLTMSSDTNPQQVITLPGLDIDDPPSGDLTWYVLEGDVGGGAGESVTVAGLPGGATSLLSDAINPADNPMNHTINTTLPPQTDALGVDVDRFGIDAALAATDNAIEVTYNASNDKWWLAYDIVGVNVFEPVLEELSSKSWTLHDDADGSGDPSPGDTVRYTLHLENSGNAAGTVTVTDAIPGQAASWMLVDTGGGIDGSVGAMLQVSGVPLPVGGAAEIVVDVVIDAVPDGTEMHNVAEYTAQPGNVMGSMVAPVVVIANAGVVTGGEESSGSGSSGGDSTDGGSTAGGGSSGGSSGSSTGAAGSSGGGGGTGVVDDSGGVDLTVSGGATTGGSGDGGGGAQDPSTGCDCRSGGESGRGAVLLAWLLVMWRARRRDPSLVAHGS